VGRRNLFIIKPCCTANQQEFCIIIDQHVGSLPSPPTYLKNYCNCEKCAKTVHTKQSKQIASWPMIDTAIMAALTLFEILTLFQIWSMCFHH
jgi:hypothetical protein